MLIILLLLKLQSWQVTEQAPSTAAQRLSHTTQNTSQHAELLSPKPQKTLDSQRSFSSRETFFKEYSVSPYTKYFLKHICILKATILNKTWKHTERQNFQEDMALAQQYQLLCDSSREHTPSHPRYRRGLRVFSTNYSRYFLLYNNLAQKAQDPSEVLPSERPSLFVFNF